MTRSERFVVACAAVLGLAASVLNPMGEAPDEPDNVAVVERIRHEKRLVVPDDLLRQGMHPPFAFVVQALATVPLEAVAPILPEAITLPGPLRVTVPLDVSSGPPRESTGPADGSRASAAPHIRSSTWLGLRWLSVIVSTVGVALALRAARTLVPECPHAVAGATGLLLLAPQVVLQSAAVAMDPFILLFAAWAALELARGLRPGEPYSTVRAGAALAGAALVRHVGVPLLAVAALVALLRARRGLGARRATVELAIVFAIALAPFLAWMARNWAVAGDPLLVSAIYEKHPAMFRHASGLSFHEVDLWVGDMARTFYAPESAKVHLPATASLAFLLVVGAALLGALATLGRDVGARAVPPRSVVAFGAVALAVTVVLPLAGNTQLFQAGGRYAIPAVPFVVAAAAAGLAHVFRSDSRWLVAIAAASAGATAVALAASIAPAFAPWASRLRGAVAYADCGGAYDPGRVRGVTVRLASATPFPGPEHDVAADFERVEYAFPIEGSSSGLTLRVVLPGGAAPVERTESVGGLGDAAAEYTHPAVRIRAGAIALAECLTPAPGAATYAYAIPPQAVENGALRLAFERAGTAAIVSVAEIRVDREAIRADEEGPRARVVAADARPWAGVRVAAPAARSRFARRGRTGTLCETPELRLEPGRYVVRARLRVNDAAEGAAVARIVAGAASRPVAASRDALHRWISVEAPIEIHAGDPPLVARVEALGAGEIDVDDLEIVDAR